MIRLCLAFGERREGVARPEFPECAAQWPGFAPPLTSQFGTISADAGHNSFIWSFNGNFRSECLNTHWFKSLDDARRNSPLVEPSSRKLY